MAACKLEHFAGRESATIIGADELVHRHQSTAAKLFVEPQPEDIPDLLFMATEIFHSKDNKST
eukprot:11282931-Karenia_brevis.AAC.1